jgi:YD repeat-containing protein
VTLGNGTTTTYGYTTQSALESIDHNLTGSSQDNTWTHTPQSGAGDRHPGIQQQRLPVGRVCQRYGGLYRQRPTQVTDALGKLTKHAYDANGNRIRTSAQIGTQWLVSCNTYTTSDKVLKA